MPEHASAQIIPFPPQSVRPPAEDPQARLQQALSALDAALVRQRAAVSGWRDSIGAVQGSVAHLDDSLSRWQRSLAALHGRAGSLDDEAHKLKNWAGRALERDDF
jgi:hypothetical protein